MVFWFFVGFFVGAFWGFFGFVFALFWFFICLFCFVLSYLVMPFMGTDLSKIMKHEKLTEDRIQFLVYQMLKGLKVCQFYYYFDFTVFFPSKLLWRTINTYHLIAG